MPFNCFSLIGQTYQETKEVYMKLHQAHGMTPNQATKVFIDGSEDDYLTTGIFAADCKFAKFEVNLTQPNSKKIHLHFSTNIAMFSYTVKIW